MAATGCHVDGPQRPGGQPALSSCLGLAENSITASFMAEREKSSAAGAWAMPVSLVQNTIRVESRGDERTELQVRVEREGRVERRCKGLHMPQRFVMGFL